MRILRILAISLLIAGLFVTPVEAATTCSLNGATLRVRLDARIDDYVLGRSIAGEIQLDGSPCDGATVTNVDSIEVEETAQTGDTVLVIDGANGGFAPGATSEGSGSSEIEFSVQLGPLGADVETLKVSGSDGPDTFALGTNGIGLNLDDDVDVTLADMANVRISVYGLGGTDSISGQGGGGTGGAYPSQMYLVGGDGNDILTGGDHGDVLSGEGGADAMDGGGNDQNYWPYDSADYATSPVAVSADLATGTGSGGDAEGDTFVSIDSLSGSEFDDSLFGDEAGNALLSGGGNDTLVARGGDDGLEGSAGGDTLDGGDGLDQIAHFASDGPIQADLGAQTITGGEATGDTLSGIEIVVGTVFDDTLTGSEGTDGLLGYYGDDVLRGRGGDDYLTGGHGDDDVEGGEGNDSLESDEEGDGDDILDGGPGTQDFVAYYQRGSVALSLDGVANDGSPGEKDNILGIEIIGASEGGDQLIGTGQRDTIKSRGGNDVVSALGGPDVVRGGSGDDDVTGSGGNDTLVGQSGGDDLSGGPGDDVLNGGPGADVLNGGPGHDVCFVDSKADEIKSCEVKRNNQRRARQPAARLRR